MKGEEELMNDETVHVNHDLHNWVWPNEYLLFSQSIDRGVQNNLKLKTRIENSVPELKYLNFSVQVLESIFFLGLSVGVQVGLFNQYTLYLSLIHI